MNQIKINTRNYSVRQDSMGGNPYLVVPVIMIQEGVHAGSDGAIYHSPEQLGRYVEAWNGIPVTITHPRFNESFVSANSPTMLEQYAVGQVFNTRLDGTQLKAEAWIRMDRIQAVSQQTLNLLNDGEPIDVSVGVFTDSLDTPGTWNGEDYYRIATNYRPDHLAVLPFEEGACNYNDGCGIRNNNKLTKKVNENEMDVKDFKAEHLKQNPLQVNADYVEKANNIRRLLDGMDRDGAYHYLEELYESTFYYKVTGGTRPTEYFKQEYSENENGEIVLSGTPTQVSRKVAYAPVVTTMQRTTPSKKSNPLNNKKMDVTKKVDDLIANTASGFCEDDREFLLTQSEEKLDKFAAIAKPVQVNETKPVEKKKEEKKEEPKVYKTSEEYIASMPKEMQDSMRNGMRLHEEQRTALIGKIQTNTKDVWTEDELKAMSSEMLQKVAGTVPAAPKEGVDFTLQGTAPIVNSEEGSAVMMPTGMGEEKK